MAKTRRAYTGAPAQTTISGALTATTTSITIAANTGWYAGGSPNLPFYVVVSPGLSVEEKILVTISGTTLTVVGGTSGRGQDGTSASAHDNGATIYPVPTALDFDEANELTAKYATQGSIVHQGASTFTELTIGGTAGHVLKVNSGTTAPEWGQVPTAGIADSAVTSAKIADGTIVAGDIADGAITSAKILDGTIATGDLADGAVTSAKIADGTIVAGDLADGAVTSAKILDGTIVNADINASAAIALSKLATGALPTGITIATGNITNGAILNEDINASAAIALSKLATGALPTGITVASANIVDGTIMDGDISSSASISPNKIAAHGNHRTRTTAQSISNSSWQKVAFGVSVNKYGTDVDYNTGTDNLELNGYGTYVISAGLTFAANGTGVRGIRIYDIDNSAVLTEMIIGAYGVFDCSVNCSIAFPHNVTPASIAVYAYQNSGGALNVKGERGTFVSAVKVAGST
jgi:hypothetical protein